MQQHGACQKTDTQAQDWLNMAARSARRALLAACFRFFSLSSAAFFCWSSRALRSLSSAPSSGVKNFTLKSVGLCCLHSKENWAFPKHMKCKTKPSQAKPSKARTLSFTHTHSLSFTQKMSKCTLVCRKRIGILLKHNEQLAWTWYLLDPLILG